MQGQVGSKTEIVTRLWTQAQPQSCNKGHEVNLYKPYTVRKFFLSLLSLKNNTICAVYLFSAREMQYGDWGGWVRVGLGYSF